MLLRFSVRFSLRLPSSTRNVVEPVELLLVHDFKECAVHAHLILGLSRSVAGVAQQLFCDSPKVELFPILDDVEKQVGNVSNFGLVGVDAVVSPLNPSDCFCKLAPAEFEAWFPDVMGPLLALNSLAEQGDSFRQQEVVGFQPCHA